LEAEGRRTRESQGGAVGRQEYWLQLYAKYHREVRRFFARRVKCAQDVEDLVQEVFASLILHDYHPRNPRAYLRTMARHHWCTYRKSRGRARRAEHQAAVLRQWEAVHTTCHAPELDPLERLLGREMEVLVHTILMGLAPVLGEALRLRFLDELEIAEAVVRVGCTRDGLQRRFRRGARSFADRWEAAYGG
jgi:RNA polymerase sigma factor (sigma-70 family)